MSTAAATTTEAKAAEVKSSAPPFQWAVLITVILGTFLGRLDQTIVNLALPKIITDFSITVNQAGWIATAYILANAIFVPIWGKLGDTVGRKKVYVTGFIMFIVGSVLAGLSWNLTSMIIFRIIQAVAGSADYPTAMAILSVTFKDTKQKAQALGLWSASFAAASVFGPLIGGPLIDSFGWRAVFLVNLPVGIIGLMMALIFIKESVSENKAAIANFDWWGATTLGICLSALTLVLDQGQTWGWFDWSSDLCYFFFVLFLYIFIRIEHFAKEPMVDLKFFRNKVFVFTLLNNGIIFMGLMGGVFLIPVFAQTFLGYTATSAGYLFMPMAILFMFSAPLGGRFVGKIESRYIIFTSTIIAGVGIFFLSFLDARSTAWDIMWPLGIMAFGMGLGMAQRTQTVAASVPVSEIGVASSILALVRNISGALGIAIFGALVNSTINSNIITISRQSVLVATDALSRAQYTALIILKSEIGAYALVFEIAAGIMLVGAFLALPIKVPGELDKHKTGEKHEEIFVEA